MRKVEVVPHDPTWQEAFRMESKRVADALGEIFVAIHHIGSTAIPGIYAKPIIDILVEVQDITQVDEQSSAMESLGYQVMGEYGIPERRFFRKDNQAGVRTHHIHIFEVGSAQVKRHLAFRDYMIAHTEAAQRYSELKRELAREHPQNIDGYIDGKDSFIKEIDLKAAQWSGTQQSIT
ncbi:MAG: GrpB family protein [Symploca sp. SIO3E6]|nr:GrpB family protein [Caldora sp. SIO3E6]